MYITILICVILYYLFTSEKLTFFRRYLKFEIVYWALGFRATIEDYLYSSCTKIELPDRTGDVAVITGGARGVGAAVVSKLMKCGVHVIIGCRNVEAGKKLVKSLRDSGIKTGGSTIYSLDIGSFTSIQEFAKNVLENFPKINILINNAGIMFVKFALTEQSHESHFMVNYLGHCFLAHLLLPRLKSSAEEYNVNSRIINVSSCAHEAGDIYFDDLTMRNMFIPSAAYAQSKLAQILFTKALDRRLKENKMPVNIYAVHPGVVNTEIFDNTTLKLLLPWAPYLFFKSPEQGARPVAYAALSKELESQSGSYISNCRVTPCSSVADSVRVQEELWDKMLQFLNVKNFGSP